MEDRLVYLDNAATTRPCDAVLCQLEYMYRNLYGNPSSHHKAGYDSLYEITKAKDNILSVACSDDIDNYDVCFTSGGTESNNISISSAIKSRPERRKIISSTIEHSSVYNTLKYYEGLGYDVVFISPNADGIIPFDKVKNEIDESTALVSIMYVNNELGTIQPVKKIGELCREKDVLFHCDCVQAFGHINVKVDEIHADYATMSFHKFGGLKGNGAIVYAKKSPIYNLMFGGHQNNGNRPGTEDVIGIISGARALEESYKDINVTYEYYDSLKKIICSALEEEGIDFRVNTWHVDTVPNIISIGFKGVDKNGLIPYLDGCGVCVSGTSACESLSGNSRVISELEKVDPSDKPYYDGTIRVSFSPDNNYMDCLQFVESVTKYIKLKEKQNERAVSCSSVLLQKT